jgi:uncharacterized membrane protein
VTRQDLKSQAKDVFRRRFKAVLTASLIYAVLALAVNEFSSYAMGTSRVLEYITDMLNSIAKDLSAATRFDINEYYSDIFRLLNPVGIAISIVVGLLLQILFAGYKWFLLSSKRGDEPAPSSIFAVFSKTGKLAVLIILQNVFTYLWSLLFLVPGIFAALRYSQAVYILYDHPEYSALECIRESKRIMRGYEGSYFVLRLSFIGWYLLASLLMYTALLITGVGSYIGGYVIPIVTNLFLLPYVYLSTAGFYDDLLRNSHTQNDDLYLK